MKTVTNLIQNIGKIRDLLEAKDYVKIESNLLLFAKVLESVKSNYKKYLRDQSHFLDFNSYDLEEMSMETDAVLKAIRSDITIKKMGKYVLKHGEDGFNEFCIRHFKIRSALIEFHSAMMYLATCLRLFEEGRAKVIKDH